MYLVALLLFLPFPFRAWWGTDFSRPTAAVLAFPFQRLGEYTAALLSICSMLLLGFADDILNLKWRHKVVLPALAALPLLIIYRVTYGVTAVLVPLQLRAHLGALIDLGPLYYAYMAAMAVFCTHSINILAGVNGVEVGQSLVLGLAVLLNSLLCIAAGDGPREHALFALYLVLPFLAVSLALFRHNWWPARVFVGDTYCYFAGMTFAVIAILGHYSKTMLLFFAPQLANFALSLPQLAGLVPCPRHRLPALQPATGRLDTSRVVLEQPLSAPARRIVALLCALRLVREYPADARGRRVLSNLTLLNTLLVWCGPLREDRLALLLMLVQAAACAAGLLVRFHLSGYLFPA